MKPSIPLTENQIKAILKQWCSENYLPCEDVELETSPGTTGHAGPIITAKLTLVAPVFEEAES